MFVGFELLSQQQLHELRWLYKGHDSIFFSPDKEKEIKKAAEKFAQLIKEGWSAFAYEKVGDKIAKPITEFSADFARVILTPPTSGGCL